MNGVRKRCHRCSSQPKHSFHLEDLHREWSEIQKRIIATPPRRRVAPEDVTVGLSPDVSQTHTAAVNMEPDKHDGGAQIQTYEAAGTGSRPEVLKAGRKQVKRLGRCRVRRDAVAGCNRRRVKPARGATNPPFELGGFGGGPGHCVA